jgi:GT2 family glycosyltransferase
MAITLSIILVNYNTAALTLQCVQSIYAQTKNVSFEVIIADNQSTDKSKEQILQHYPNTVWIDMGYNAGFARANNAGIQLAKGKYILLLNTDTIVLDNALEHTINLFETHQPLAACGVQLLNADGSPQISGAKNIIGGLNLLLPLPYLGTLIKKLGYAFGAKPPSIEAVAANTPVDWIIGAFILTTKATIAKAGLLDEDFFMYAEEMEWCSRLKKQGPLVLFAQPKVTHLGGGSSNKAYNEKIWDNTYTLCTQKGKQILLSYFLRIRKEFGLMWFLNYFFWCLIAVPIFFVGVVFSKFFTQNAAYNFKSWLGFTKNIIAACKFLPKLILGKKFFYKV